MKKSFLFGGAAVGGLFLAALCLPLPFTSHGNSKGSTSIAQNSPRSTLAPAAINSPDQLFRELQSSSSPGERSGQLRRFLPGLVQKDSAAAARFAEKVADVSLRDEALRVVAQEWALKDSAAAVAWADQLSANLPREQILEAVCLGQSAESPEKATRLASDLHLSDDLLANLAQQWARKDLRTALSWAKNQAAGIQRDQLISRATLVQATTDPLAAARLAVEQIPAGAIQTEAIISVVHAWAQIDPVRAAAWVARFPEGIVQSRAENEIRGAAAIHLVSVSR